MGTLWPWVLDNVNFSAYRWQLFYGEDNAWYNSQRCFPVYDEYQNAVKHVPKLIGNSYTLGIGMKPSKYCVSCLWCLNLIMMTCIKRFCPRHVVIAVTLHSLDVLWKLYLLVPKLTNTDSTTWRSSTANTEANPYTWSWANSIYHTFSLPVSLLNAILSFPSVSSKWLLFQEVSQPKFFLAAFFLFHLSSMSTHPNLLDLISILMLGDLSKLRDSSVFGAW